jgi:hypothetical protein
MPITGQNAQHIDTRAQHRSDDHRTLANEQTRPAIRPKRIAIAHLLIRGKMRMVSV